MARQPFTFLREADTLNGWIEEPDGPGPHPAMIMVHGSGRCDVGKWGDDELRANLRRAGVAVVVWDKPGCGQSSGTFDDFQDWRHRADEVAAAMDALRERPGIDAARIGLWGISQGGWVGPMVAVRRPDLAFMILLSGPAHRGAAQGLYLVRENLRLEGEPPEQVEAIVGSLARCWALGTAGAAYEEALAPLAPFVQQPFLNSIGWTSPSRDLYRRWFSSPNLGVDAAELLAHVACPVLALFGERDSQVDWRESVAVYRSALVANRDVTIRTFPGADHCLLHSETGSMRETGRHWAEKTVRPVAGYVDAIMSWLTERGFVRAAASAAHGA
jgi:pimeloyl-ACP methyl ester carboxylesterase